MVRKIPHFGRQADFKLRVCERERGERRERVDMTAVTENTLLCLGNKEEIVGRFKQSM